MCRKVVVQKQGTTGLVPESYKDVHSVEIVEKALVILYGGNRKKVFAADHWKEFDESDHNSKDLLAGIQKGEKTDHEDGD